MASGISIIILLYTLLMKDNFKGKEAIYIHLLNDSFFMILLSTTVFYLIYQRYNIELIVYRFHTINAYIRFKMLYMIKSLGLFFGIIVVSQSIMFSLVDPLFYIISFLYRYIALFWLFILVGIIAMIGKRKNDMKRIMFLYIGWNLFYTLFCISSDSMINLVMPFMILKQINVFEISRLLILSLIIVYYALQSDGRKMLE